MWLFLMVLSCAPRFSEMRPSHVAGVSPSKVSLSSTTWFALSRRTIPDVNRTPRRVM
jgi:hypothetical protein